jgi:hypothetical protein
MKITNTDVVDGPHPLVQALHDGIQLDRRYKDGRVTVTMDRHAMDALRHVLSARQRHMPLPDGMLEELEHWCSYVCHARLERGGNARCDEIVADAWERCMEHGAIDQIHPEARLVIDALSPRARHTFELLATGDNWRLGLALPLQWIAKEMRTSTSTLSRAIDELNSVHLAWRDGRKRPVTLNPLVAYRGGAKEQREAIKTLRRDRYEAFAHLGHGAPETTLQDDVA